MKSTPWVGALYGVAGPIVLPPPTPAQMDSQDPNEFMECEIFFIGDESGNGSDYQDPFDDPIDLEGKPLRLVDPSSDDCDKAARLLSGVAAQLVSTCSEVPLINAASSSSGYGLGEVGPPSLPGVMPSAKRRRGEVAKKSTATSAEVTITSCDDTPAPAITLSQRLLDNWLKRRESRLAENQPK